MISKNEVKYIQSLYHKKTREAEGLFIAEGEKLVNELLQSNHVVKKIFATKDWHSKTPFHNIQIVEDFELEKISAQSTPQRVLAIVEQKKIIQAPNVQGCVILALDGIQDPGNLGTIIRIADWFGVTNIVASEDTVELYNPKVIQSTMGSFIRVNTWYGNLETFLQSANVPVFGALLSGENIYATNKISEGILVIGNESKGIRSNMLPYIRHAITIPKRGGAESLNAAVAAGIILSHLLK